MGRDIDTAERDSLESPRFPEQARSQGPPLERERQNIRERAALMSASERETLREIGSFRMIAAEDLTRHRYAGDPVRMRQDVRGLINQGLLRRREVWTGGQNRKFTVLVLTKAGRTALLRQGEANRCQEIYAGFVKPAEVYHDAAIYRMYQLEAGKIRQVGGRVTRVILDYELKKKVYSPLAKTKNLSHAEYAKRQAEIARAHGLKVIRGHILLPDLRIEYEKPNGERAQVDLELATQHYRGSQVRGKAAAGFKMYAPKASVARLSSAFDPEFVAQIFSL